MFADLSLCCTCQYLFFIGEKLTKLYILNITVVWLYYSSVKKAQFFWYKKKDFTLTTITVMTLADLAKWAFAIIWCLSSVFIKFSKIVLLQNCLTELEGNNVLGGGDSNLYKWSWPSQGRR